MPADLKLAPDLALPLDVVTRRTAVVGQTDTGKTSTAVVLVEEARAAGAQVVVIDPSGAWWGVTSSADGRKAGLDMIVMGGEHGEVPLNESAGKAVARLVAERRYSLVLDLDRPHFRSWASRQRFVADFLSELYELCRSQVLVVVDEAHRFAPQAVRDEGGDAARCLGAVVDVIALGRRRGLAMVAITQRLAKLHKDVLELCEIIIAHRLRGNNDRKALQGWLENAGEEVRAIMAEVARLEKGVARVSAPTLGIEGVFRIRPKRTFDSSRSIDVGESAVEPTARTEADLEEVRLLLADTIVEAERDDPRKLREEIERLREELAGAVPPGTVEEVEDVRNELATAIEELGPFVPADAITDGSIVPISRIVASRLTEALGTPVLPEWAVTRIDEIVVAIDGLRSTSLSVAPERIRDVATMVRRVSADLQGLSGDAGENGAGPAGSAEASVATADGSDERDSVGRPGGPSAHPPGRHAIERAGRAGGTRRAVMPPTAPTAERGDGPTLKAGHHRIIEALGRYEPRGLTRAELVPLARFSSKRTVGDYVAYLKTNGLIFEEDGTSGRLHPADGQTTAQEPFTRDDVYAMAGPLLKAGHRRMLEALFTAHPKGYTRPELAGLVGMNKRTAGDYVAHLKRFGLIDERARRLYAGYVFYLTAEDAAA